MSEIALPHPSLLALIAEARRRARRRRLVLATCTAGALAAAFFVLVRETGGSAATPLPVHAELTIINGNIRAIGGGRLGRALWSCGIHHGCWEPESLAWSPDGTRLAFGGTSIGGAGSLDGLHVADVGTGAVSIIRPLTAGERSWLDVAWSPNGARIAYVANGTINTVRPDGRDHRVLRTGTEGHDRAPTWSPDSRRLAYEVDTAGGARVYTIGLDGAHRRLVANHATWPAWSPDGRLIAYRGCGGVRFVTPGGTDATPGAAACGSVGVDGAPVWSPRGDKIAMAVWRNGTYVMNGDGTGLERVGPPPSAIPGSVRNSWLRPAWRPTLATAMPYAPVFPLGTFLTKITAADLRRAGLDPSDAHWEKVTYGSDGTWRDEWFHPRQPGQPVEHGRYVVRGDTLRLLGTPDTVRWHYANGRLTFEVVRVPDALARLVYTAHAWRKII